jgi:C4-dicarboxylate-specific signal transduction histidine kinase
VRLPLVRRIVGPVVEQGVTPALPDPLKKRIRLTNALSLFGAFVMLASIPFDRSHAPRWMLAEDVAGAAAYLLFPLLNRTRHLVASRLLCIVVSNLIVLGNAVLLGPESGAQMVFVAMTAMPFALFDLADGVPLASCVALSIACFAVVELRLLARFQDLSAAASAPGYYPYSAVVTLGVLVFSLYQTSAANAKAEQQLRRDIAERLRAERELELTRQTSIYSAKMAALGEMSGNVGHEINNPLAAILLRVHRLRRLADKDRLDGDAVRHTASDVERIVDRIRRIVDALRSFARDAEKDPMRPERVAGIVADTIELCTERFRQHSIELAIEPIADDIYVDCRGSQIAQVLLNLLGNAHDAVETATRRRVAIAVEADEREVRIAVSDSGPGIPPALRARIMEPFFTTKEIGKGTGLGLSVSKGIAEAHGGRLTYDPEAAETRFVLALRRAPAPAVAPKSNAPRAASG